MSKYDDEYAKDDDDYEPPKRRSRYEETDDDDDDDRPRRRARSGDDDEDDKDERPARRRPRDDDDDDERPRRSRSRDDDDERPARSRRVADDDKPAARNIKRGWGAAESIKDSTSPFAQRLKVTEEPQIIKFLEDDPYASFRQHWVERQGQKSFTCISDMDDRGCPLCDIGNRPSTQFAFNVALLTDGEPLVKSFQIGNRVIDQLKNFHTDPRQGPLTKHYWAISKTGKGSTTVTNLQMVKERDLDEEWGILPLDEAELKTLRKSCYDADIISIPKYKELLAIADEES